MNRPALLKVQDLRVDFGTGTDVIAGVDLAVAPGETLAIVGESGSGKSVTSLAIMGLLSAKGLKIEGRAEFDGQALDLSQPKSLAGMRGDRMAMIFQEPMTSLNPAFRIGDQIAEAVLCHRDVPAAEAKARALDIMRKVGISAPERRMRQYPHELSGGMRQRVMIAMALVNEPALLIADEPTTALDVTIQAQILDLIARLQRDRGMAVVFITHDLGVVAQVAHRVAVMYAGRIAETGTVEQVFNDPQHPYTIGLLGSIPSLTGPRTRLATVPGTVPSPAEMPQGCRFSTRCPFAQPKCAEQPALREITDGHHAACHFAPLEQSFGAAA
ncbi:ABC transporter ATP-binding protein [Paracoccus sp. (in: a-proteobacteria)]|uniref:ABC transporter ATP-binding protein n=1 Tax=Paracoccus sp. TaxID=267 RepID=UPI0026DF0995|nr:ABC transporter ATP-binding protein [Paracoccus sp. (in: a-proteobacteria)]MDO5371015.1 ABC transporter ATP-binding protein [Paracoccus sp. (in: a-proteobacteria)]